MIQCYWSRQDGNGTVVWADAHLTELGVAQAEIASRFWAKEIAEQHIPTAQTYYTSPLTRCTDTANITFSGLKLPGRHPFVPTVKEVSLRKSKLGLSFISCSCCGKPLVYILVIVEAPRHTFTIATLHMISSMASPRMMNYGEPT